MFRRSDADKRVDTLIVNTKISHVVCRYAHGQKIGKPLNLRVFGSKLNKESILDSQNRLRKSNKTV
jgi:hypothetical protein